MAINQDFANQSNSQSIFKQKKNEKILWDK